MLAVDDMIAPTWSRSVATSVCCRGHAQGRRRLQPRLHLRQPGRQSGRRRRGRHGPAGLLSSQETLSRVVRPDAGQVGSPAALFRWREFAQWVIRKTVGPHQLCLKVPECMCIIAKHAFTGGVQRSKQWQRSSRNRSAAIVIRGWRGPGGSQRPGGVGGVDVGGFHDRSDCRLQQDLMGDMPLQVAPGGWAGANAHGRRADTRR